MELKEAIAGSVEKWRALLAGERDLEWAFRCCGLCYLGMIGSLGFDTVGMCECCPLFLSGNGCLEDGSSFLLAKKACDEVGFSDINHPLIRPHAEAMYAALLKIQREHDAE